MLGEYYSHPSIKYQGSSATTAWPVDLRQPIDVSDMKNLDGELITCNLCKLQCPK